MNYQDYLKKNKDLIGMIHVRALPGTPKNNLSVSKIIDIAVNEAKIYKKCGLKTVMIENMHDVPYTKITRPEIIAVMSIIGKKIKELGLYCGVQILAGGNQEALAVAKAGDLDFIRAEGYVFGHIGDEGYFDSCAGELLRYRKSIGADNVMIFTDIKKKHSSHKLTEDVDIVETAKAAQFFLTDGVIITGCSTGVEPSVEELFELKNVKVRKLIGSGITYTNINKYYNLADVFIVGSYFKKNGNWENELDVNRIKKLIVQFNKINKK
jgi:uncharacterized protein